MGKIKIQNKIIGEKHPVFIIAEAGVNHNGSLKTAKKMVDAAQNAGADAIKFQTFNAEKLVSINAPQAKYQKKNSPEKDQYTMLKKLELSYSEFRELSGYCRKKGMIFLSTPFDDESAEFLSSIGMAAFKISSGDLTNLPFIKKISGLGKPVILSTGMATLSEVRKAVRVVSSAGNNKLVLLHCTSNYPVRYDEVNLTAMLTLKREFGFPSGYSDHTEGIEVSVAAVALGACMIEKHFTLNRKMEGPDHKASIELGELRDLVSSIRNVERAIGSGVKVPAKSEKNVMAAARKSIVAGIDINKGERVTKNMLAIKRPGNGIPPSELYKLIGRKTKRAINKDTLMSWKDLS